jgi:ABC-type transport system involved in cytochrome bd biosynthesis fused ATPase/permease subunit
VDGEVLLPGSERLRAWQRGVTYAGARPPLLASRVREAVTMDQEHHGRPAGGGAPPHRPRSIFELRPIGEQGQNLSAGQLQRLGLARALLSDPHLLVLDEATNALDPGAEAQVLGDLRRWRPELTVAMVSHREESFALCDRVVRLG